MFTSVTFLPIFLAEFLAFICLPGGALHWICSSAMYKQNIQSFLVCASPLREKFRFLKILSFKTFPCLFQNIPKNSIIFWRKKKFSSGIVYQAAFSIKKKRYAQEHVYKINAFSQAGNNNLQNVQKKEEDQKSMLVKWFMSAVCNIA